MSRYKAKHIPLDKLPVSINGVAEPLCESCANRDCSNPIRPCKVSVFGVTKVRKCYVSNNSPSFVVQCEGFIPEMSSDEEDED